MTQKIDSFLMVYMKHIKVSIIFAQFEENREFCKKKKFLQISNL